MHACIYDYMHSYFIHAYMPTYMCVCAYVHTYMDSKGNDLLLIKP